MRRTLISTILLCSAFAASAQTPQAVFVTATDRQGAPVSVVQVSDIELRVNGKPAQVTRITRETPALRLAVLLDASKSNASEIAAERDAAAALIRQIIRPGIDAAMVASFDTETVVEQNWSDDVSKLLSALGTIRRGSATALTDALANISDRFNLLKLPPSTLKIMLLVSDGQDNQSRLSRQQMLDAVTRAGMRVYVINTGQGQTHYGDLTLRRLVEVTGGRMYRPRSEGVDPSKFLNQLHSDLRNAQFQLTFVSVAATPSLELKIKAHSRDLHLLCPEMLPNHDFANRQ